MGIFIDFSYAVNELSKHKEYRNKVIFGKGHHAKSTTKNEKKRIRRDCVKQSKQLITISFYEKANYCKLKTNVDTTENGKNKQNK